MTNKTAEFIEKAIKIHGDRYDYSKVEYIKASQKVIIICKEHGEFTQTSGNHLYGYNCIKCSKANTSNKQRYTQDKFINKAKEIHGDLYDYSKLKYIDSKTKIIIICKTHGDFQQAPNKHLQKQGCPKCGGHQISNNELFISQSKIIHGNKYDYSKVEYINSQTKVIIICKIHGEFNQVPNSHLQSCGCKLCGIIDTTNSLKSNYDDFINKANEKHGDKYDYSKVEYIKAIQKIIIICKEHGAFEQTPSDHLTSKYGCNKCSLLFRSGIKKTTEDFINESKGIHGDLYDYSKSVYIGCEKKLLIICKKHGEFEQQPNNHLSRKGCPNCGKQKLFDSRKSNTTDFINNSIKIHKNKYDYSNVDYTNSNKKITIICNEHGEFEQTPTSHLSGRGCKLCGIEITRQKMTLSTNDFIFKSKNIYGDKYEYSKVDYTNSNKNVIIICKEHGEFNIRPNNHINSYQGCMKCQTKKQYSKVALNWLNSIQLKENITIQHAENEGEFIIPNTNYKADGYCQETNTIYEFHGDYWHGNPNKFILTEINKTTKCSFGELYQKTLDKELFIINMGFNLITMWESEWNKINKNIDIEEIPQWLWNVSE